MAKRARPALSGAPAEQQRYPHPPIVEVVIEIRFASPLDKNLIEKLFNHFRGEYPLSEPITEMSAFVDMVNRQTQYKEGNTGHRLTSGDLTNVLMVTAANLVFSRLAPYQGWPSFQARARREWDIWRRIAKHHKIQRIGLRYINRIDIPMMPETTIKVEDYVNVYVHLPEPENYKMHVFNTNFLQSSGYLGQDNCMLVINSSVGPSPLINHIGITLDLDIGRNDDVPQNTEEIWSLLESMRYHKNQVFEASITDKSRELFR